MKQVLDEMLDSPAGRTAGSIIVGILAGLLTNTFVVEITVNGILHWETAYKSISAYGLLLVVVCTYLYNLRLFRRDQALRNFSDDDYCWAYMRSKCLPEVAERAKRMIRDGNADEFDEALEQIKRALK